MATFCYLIKTKSKFQHFLINKSLKMASNFKSLIKIGIIKWFLKLDLMRPRFATLHSWAPMLSEAVATSFLNEPQFDLYFSDQEVKLQISPSVILNPLM